MNLGVAGPSDSILAFVHATQHGTRTMLITDVSLTGAAGSAATGTLTGFVYVVRDPAGGHLLDDYEPEPDPAPTTTPTPVATPEPEE